MKILVSVVGRFHAFDLANQLQKHNMLYKLNTTYPQNITTRWGLQRKNIASNIHLEFLSRYIKKYLPERLRDKCAKYIYKAQAISNIKYLQNADVFIGWSGSSLEALIEAKKLNIVTVVERGSSHYNHQMKILIEENQKFNKNFKPDYNTWQRELLEYELADFISIPSSFVKRTFLENGISENKLLMNPYGVDLLSFKQENKIDTVFRVIFAGNLSLRKGAQYLLQAFGELNLPNCELWHLGSISEEMYPLMEKYKSDKIKYLGHKPQGELYHYYSQGTVFIMMSLEEGLSMVQLQAMACGLPLICTTNTGGEDLITQDGEEGFIIPIRDVEALKEKISFLYNNPAIALFMGQKAKARVTKGFTWDDYGDRYVKALNTLVITK